jgi:hypothetical protein
MGQDLLEYGVSGFSLETLVVLEIKPDMSPAQIRSELKVLEALWRETHSEDDFY